jgi:hypothetical protein
VELVFFWFFGKCDLNYSLQIAYEELIDVIGREYSEVHFDNLPFIFPP